MPSEGRMNGYSSNDLSRSASFVCQLCRVCSAGCCSIETGIEAGELTPTSLVFGLALEAAGNLTNFDHLYEESYWAMSDVWLIYRWREVHPVSQATKLVWESGLGSFVSH